MARRIPAAPVIITGLLAALSAPLAADTRLVQHDFDDDMLSSGPDTFQVFINRKSKAQITSHYASNGYASAHLTDVPGDRDFVEFQGYFPVQQNGNIHISFSFMMTTTDNAFNVALVGQKRYQMHPDGINFWLLYKNGWLRHKSNGIPKKLFQPQSMQWYQVNVAMDMDNGNYELRIDDEAGETIIQKTRQAFAPGPADHYSLKEFSFTGDLGDRQPTDIYIDALHITTSNNTTIPETVAPGRRQYFIEQWDSYHKKLQGKLQCLPARNLEDFAIDNEGFAALVANNQLETLYQLTRPHADHDSIDVDRESDLINAIIAWQKACDALHRSQLDKADEQIAKAVLYKPGAYIFRLTKLIIDAARDMDYYDTYYAVTALESYANDIRTEIALSMVAFYTGDQEQNDTDVSNMLAKLSDSDIRELRETGAQPLSEQYRSHLHHYMPDNWQDYLQWLVAIEQRYYALLWQGQETLAGELAANTGAIFKQAGIKPGIWLERQADALFFAGHYQQALPLYQQALLQRIDREALLLKMADIYHILGDKASEKSAREMIYRNFSRSY